MDQTDNSICLFQACLQISFHIPCSLYSSPGEISVPRSAGAAAGAGPPLPQGPSEPLFLPGSTRQSRHHRADWFSGFRPAEMASNQSGAARLPPLHRPPAAGCCIPRLLQSTTKEERPLPADYTGRRRAAAEQAAPGRAGGAGTKNEPCKNRPTGEAARDFCTRPALF